jgi:hypothetical protein
MLIRTKDLPKQIVYRKTHVQFCDYPFLKITLYGGTFGKLDRNDQGTATWKKGKKREKTPLWSRKV